MAEESSRSFKSVKVGLIILYALAVIASIILIVVTINALVSVSKDNNKLTPEEKGFASILSLKYFCL